MTTRETPNQSPLVACTNLTKDYYASRAGGSVRAVNAVSIEIERGSTLGLVGESGSGKSTLGRLLLRLEEPTAGDVVFDGARVGEGAVRDFRKRVQIVLQDPYAALNPRRAVGQSVGLPLAAQHLVRRSERPARVAELLEMVGLDRSHAGAYPHELSGGQLQRVGIARALASEPEFIVLDEAVSALDVSIRAQILNLLRELQQRLGLTYLFISHDLAIVRYMASTIAVMFRGQIIERAARDILFSHPAHPYTRELLAAIPGQATVVEDTTAGGVERIEEASAEGGCVYRPSCRVGRERATCRQAPPALTNVADGHSAACFFPFEGGSADAPSDSGEHRSGRENRDVP